MRARKRGVERAKDLSNAAVFCRALGHGRTPFPPSRAREVELRRQGLRMVRLKCPDCGYVRGYIQDRSTYQRVGRITPDYPDGYLLKDGQGRLSREDAWRESDARGVI